MKCRLIRRQQPPTHPVESSSSPSAKRYSCRHLSVSMVWCGLWWLTSFWCLLGVVVAANKSQKRQKLTKQEKADSLLQTFASMCTKMVSSSTATTTKSSTSSSYQYSRTTTMSSSSSTSSPSQKRLLTRKHVNALQWLVSVTGKGSLLLPTSPQHQAACWILLDDPKRTSLNPRLVQFQQRYALAVLWFSSTHGNSTSSSWDVSDRWMTKSHECHWYGITCSYRVNLPPSFPFGLFQRVVTILDMGFNHVGGLLPRELSLLTHLQEIDLHGNDLQGVVPHRILQSLTQLRVLKLHMNGFFGSMHTELGHLRRLEELSLFGNYFAGTIPTELAKLSHLRVVDLYANFLQGTIPSVLGQLRHLRELDVHDNNLVGRMPASLTHLVEKGQLKSLVCDCLNDKNHKPKSQRSSNGSSSYYPQEAPKSAPEVQCEGCTMCCQGIPRPKCVDMKTQQEERRMYA